MGCLRFFGTLANHWVTKFVMQIKSFGGKKVVSKTAEANAKLSQEARKATLGQQSVKTRAATLLERMNIPQGVNLNIPQKSYAEYTITNIVEKKFQYRFADM